VAVAEGEAADGVAGIGRVMMSGTTPKAN
jgi:hypothetical protein